MQPGPHVHVVSDVKDELSIPIALPVASQNNKRQELHHRDDVSLLSIPSKLPPILIQLICMKHIVLPVNSSNPLRNGLPPVILARAVAPGRARRSRMGKSFSKTAVKLHCNGASSCSLMKSRVSQKSSHRRSSSPGLEAFCTSTLIFPREPRAPPALEVTFQQKVERREVRGQG